MKNQDLVQHKYQLLNVVLEKLAIEKYVDEVPEAPVGLSFSTESRGERITEDNLDVGYSYLTVKLYFEEPNPKLFELELILKGECLVINKEDNLSEKFDEFLNIYALPLLWPFAREIVWNMLVRMNFPPLLLPSINVGGTVQASLKLDTDN